MSYTGRTRRWSPGPYASAYTRRTSDSPFRYEPRVYELDERYDSKTPQTRVPSPGRAETVHSSDSDHGRAARPTARGFDSRRSKNPPPPYTPRATSLPRSGSRYPSPPRRESAFPSSYRVRTPPPSRSESGTRYTSRDDCPLRDSFTSRYCSPRRNSFTSRYSRSPLRSSSAYGYRDTNTYESTMRDSPPYTSRHTSPYTPEFNRVHSHLRDLRDPLKTYDGPSYGASSSFEASSRYRSPSRFRSFIVF